MINRCLKHFGGAFLLGLLFVSFVLAQRVIPFRVASDDPAGKFSFSEWPVMGKFEGTVEISENGSKRLLKIKLTRGELLATKDSKKVLTVTPFLAKQKDKGFQSVVFSNDMAIEKQIEAGVPVRLEPHEFLIELKEKHDLSKHWLAFRVRIECPFLACYTYSHSPADIFSR